MSLRRSTQHLLAALVLSAAAEPALALFDLVPSAHAQASDRKEAAKKQFIDQKRLQIEAEREKYGEEANKKRAEAIAQLKKILAEQKLAPDTKAEMLMRLAELYWEQSKWEYQLEMKKYDDDYEKWFNLPPEQQKKQTEPKVATTNSQAYTRKAIENYRVILQNYPNYNRIDEALFFLAFSLNDVGEAEEARDMYDKLVKNFPQSAFVPDAYNAIGEYYFNNNNAFKALQNYKKAVEFKDSKIYTFALYKLAWCYYNVGEFDEAIAKMTDLIEESRRREAAGEGAGISLVDEALNDMVLFLSELGDLERAEEILKRIADKRYYRKFLSRLGTIYSEQGKVDDAVVVFRKLIAEQTNSSDNPTHQNEIVKLYWGRDRFDEANEEINKLVENYGRTSSWASYNKENKDALKESDRLIERNLSMVAKDSHTQALKRKSVKLLQLAEENYKRYLDYFPSGSNAYEMRFWYAEVLYKLKKYDVATTEYEKVVEADGKGKFLKDAAFNTIFSIDEFIKLEKTKWDRETEAERKRRLASKDPKEKYAPIALRDWEERLIKACDTYARVLPNDEKTLNIIFRSADIYYEHNEFKKANDRFLQIVRTKPKSELAQDAVHTILDSYKKIEDWVNLNAVAREFYGNPDVGSTEKFKTELRDIYSRASFKIAEGHAASEKWADAAGGFEGFYREFSDSGVRDLALFNAAFYAGKSGDKGRQVALRHEFVDTFPKPAGKEGEGKFLYQKALANLASHYESIADFGKAAELYRKLHDSDKKFEGEGVASSKDALYNAALFRQSMGDWAGAVKDFGDYVATYTEDADVLSNRLRIAKIYKDFKQYDLAMAAYKAIYSDAKISAAKFAESMLAWVEYGRILGLKGDRAGQLAAYTAGLKYFDTNSKKFAEGAAMAPYYAAEMRFELLEPRFAEFSKIVMPSDTKKSVASLKQKQDGLKTLEKSYIDVLNLKQGEWGIAALYRIGSLYGDFATKLKTAPCPPKLTEDQCSIYKFGLEDKAYPLIDKAVDAYTKAREKSYELQLYTTYTRSSLQELSNLRPEEYPPGAERLPEPDYSTNPLAVADFVK